MTSPTQSIVLYVGKPSIHTFLENTERQSHAHVKNSVALTEKIESRGNERHPQTTVRPDGGFGVPHSTPTFGWE